MRLRIGRRALVALPLVLVVAALIALVSHLIVASVVNAPPSEPWIFDLGFLMRGFFLLFAALGLLAASLALAAWLMTGNMLSSRISMQRAWEVLLLSMKEADYAARRRLFIFSLPAIVLLPLGVVPAITILSVSTVYALISTDVIIIRLVLAIAFLLELAAFLVTAYGVLTFLHWILTGRWITSRRELFKWR